MISFKNDYNQVGHPNILNRLSRIKDNQYVGYGEDEICESAKIRIKEKIQNENADIHFLVGGTQCNKIVIATLLKNYEGVISAGSGHINTHETGAIELTGHKVIVAESKDGKIDEESVLKILKEHHEDANKEHTVKPGMVYISNPTELGTVYSRQELLNLHELCRKYDIPLFMDGARLAYLFDSKGNDINIEDLKDLVDVYYIGGTKCGAMIGEAIVFNDKKYAKNFRYSIKQFGFLLAKGFLLGVQFDELFKNDLYFILGKETNKLAGLLEEKLEELNISMLAKRYSNQLFPILNDNIIEKLKEKYSFEYWGRISENTSCIRLVVSWSSRIEHINELVDDLAAYLQQ